MKKLMIVASVGMLIMAIYRTCMAEYLWAWLDLIIATSFYLFSKYVNK